MRPAGGVAEWSNAPVLKTGVRESVPWVRIPPPPPATLFSLRDVRLGQEYPVKSNAFSSCFRGETHRPGDVVGRLFIRLSRSESAVRFVGLQGIIREIVCKVVWRGVNFACLLQDISALGDVFPGDQTREFCFPKQGSFGIRTGKRRLRNREGSVGDPKVSFLFRPVQGGTTPHDAFEGQVLWLCAIEDCALDPG